MANKLRIINLAGVGLADEEFNVYSHRQKIKRLMGAFCDDELGSSSRSYLLSARMFFLSDWNIPWG
jgi:hypothetical protein